MTKEWIVYNHSVAQSFAMLQIRYCNVEEDVVQRLRKEMGEDYYLEKVIGVYADHLTEEDLEGLIAFYSSDLGKKIGSKKLLTGLSNISVKWAEDLTDRFRESNIKVDNGTGQKANHEKAKTENR